MRSALVLNATYEPLSVVPSRRAACLVLADKADIVEDDGTELHAAIISVPNPLVIRLRYVVKVPYHRRTALSRRAVFARDEHVCQYCGQLADSIDHIIPRSRGGQARVGERRRGVPPVQPAQARPHTERGRDGPGPPGARPARAGLGDGVGGPGARRVEAVPGARQLSWTVEQHHADAASFHALTPAPAAGERLAWVSSPSSPALVLGSAQRDEAVDRRIAAVARHRRGPPAQRRWSGARRARRGGLGRSRDHPRRPAVARRRRAGRCTGSGRRGRRRWPRSASPPTVHRGALVRTRVVGARCASPASDRARCSPRRAPSSSASPSGAAATGPGSRPWPTCAGAPSSSPRSSPPPRPTPPELASIAAVVPASATAVVDALLAALP